MAVNDKGAILLIYLSLIFVYLNICILHNILHQIVYSQRQLYFSSLKHLYSYSIYVFTCKFTDLQVFTAIDLL